MSMEMSSGESSMTSVPDFVIAEVVSRLPIKYLLRSKSVCKRWLHIISSSYHKLIRDSIDLRRRNDNNPPSLLLWLGFGAVTFTDLLIYVLDASNGKLCSNFSFKLPILHHPYAWTAYSCHGLVCFSSNVGRHIYLCNPTTREYVNIPESPASHYTCMMGLGIVPRTDHYKIVRWFFPSKKQIDSQSQPPGCEIFDVTDGKDPGGWSWRAVTNRLKFIRFNYKIQPVCINGVIYWLVFGPSRHFMLLAFDTENEESQLISVPEGVTTQCHNIYLLELRGCACVALDVNRERTRIWSLQDSANQKWVQLYDIEYLCRVMTGHLKDDSAEELVSMPPSVGLSIQYYNNKSNKVRDGARCDFLHNWSPCVFFECLFSLKRRDF